MQFSNINYNLYKSFVIVYETRNISKAADMLYISQPAVSHNIKELEKQLGVQLFYKRSSGMNSTSEADTLYKYISSAFNSIVKGELTIADMAQLKTGIIKIGVPTHLSILYLAKTITNFRKKYRDIKIEIVNKPINDLLVMLQSQNVDVIINSEPVINLRTSIDVEYLESYPHCFFTTDKFYEDKTYCIEDINNMPLIITSQNSEDMRILKNGIGNISIDPVIEAGTAEDIVKLVKQNNGIGYAQEEYIKDELKSGKFKKLKTSFTLPKLDIYCGYITENLSFAPKSFIEYITNKQKD